MYPQHYTSLIILILLFYATRTGAQEGKALYHVYAQNGQYRNAELLFNDSASLYTVERKGMDPQNNFDSTGFSVSQTEGMISGISFAPSRYDEKGAQVYRNFRQKKILLRVTQKGKMNAFIVSDNWLGFSWKIKEKYRTISGYKCQQAIGRFRGREYRVWFTKDIPLPYGPWKLYGLPGLIIKAKSPGIMNIELATITYPVDGITDICPPYEPGQKTLKELVYYNDHILEFVMKKMSKLLPKDACVRVGEGHYSTTLAQDRDHQLERLYEWEKKIPKRNNYIPAQVKHDTSITIRKD
ncbi:MAG TPA: GLPGLI family protein [Edaphocola sp.]|nr:GLPGLI family protein [Edaphocola sp.]